MRLPAGSPPVIVRGMAYPGLATLGAVFLLLANLPRWLDSSVFDSSNLSQRVDNVLAEPQVQE
jgi:small-conductance mechanosensitive channel